MESRVDGEKKDCNFSGVRRKRMNKQEEKDRRRMKGEEKDGDSDGKEEVNEMKRRGRGETVGKER